MEELSFDDLKRIKEIILADGIVAFPTETVFGMGVRFDHKASFDKLIKVKRRPEGKPFSMMLSDPKKIGEYACVTKRQQAVIDAFMPGEITVILKKKPIIPDYVTLNGPTIGIRIPAYPKLLKMLSYINIPLLVPSCNRSGEKPCADADQVQAIFQGEIQGVVKDKVGDSVPSTVVLLTSQEPKVLRQGKISAAEIMKVWNESED